MDIIHKKHLGNQREHGDNRDKSIAYLHINKISIDTSF